MSRTTLKHSTSSVVLERGCSTGIPFIRLNPQPHCLVSISAAKAMSVSCEPRHVIKWSKNYFKCQVSLSMLYGINTYRVTSNRLKSFCLVECYGIRSLTINSKNSAHIAGVDPQASFVNSSSPVFHPLQVFSFSIVILYEDNHPVPKQSFDILNRLLLNSTQCRKCQSSCWIIKGSTNLSSLIFAACPCLRLLAILYSKARKKY